MNSIDSNLILKIFQTNDKILKFIQENILNNSSLTPNQFFILGKIVSGEISTINELKSDLNISPPALSQLLNRLESYGFIKRSFGKTKREINIKATIKAIELYETLNEKYFSLITEKFSNIKDKDKEIMIKFLEYIEKVI